MSEPTAPTAAPTAPRGVPLGPVPTTVDVGTAQFGDTKLLVLTLHTPLGTQNYFFDGDGGSQIARVLQRAAREVVAWEQITSKKIIVPRKEV